MAATRARKRIRRPPEGTSEWVGGTLLPPFFVTEAEPYRPELIIREQRAPPEARFDFAEVRRDLGLPG